MSKNIPLFRKIDILWGCSKLEKQKQINDDISLNILYFTYLIRITCYVLTIVFAQSLKIQVHAEITLFQKRV